MENADNKYTFDVYRNIRTDSGNTNNLGYGYFNPTDPENLSPVPVSDTWITVLLTRTYDIYEYVDTAKDDTIYTIKRQEVNPYFIEFSFFDDVERIKVTNGQDLTAGMISFIKTRRPDVATLTDTQIKEWFNLYGRNQLPWNKGTSTETTLDDITLSVTVTSNVISKARYFDIKVNK
jgi:hypothetical protein